MTCDEAAPLIEAYTDGELDLERALAVEAHIAGCAACVARLGDVRGLSRTLQAAGSLRAPESLADRIRSANAGTGKASAATRSLVRRSWLAIAASVAIIGISVAGIMHQRAVAADQTTTEAVIEGHIRSLMAGHLTDVASSDRHTVKPWFAGRVDFSPTVIDLVNEGYPLVGGRLDYIDHHTAAALVYARRQHTINVFIWPEASGSASHVTRTDPRGYHVISWTRGGVAVWVVSDLAIDELTDFAQKLDAGM